MWHIVARTLWQAIRPEASGTEPVHSRGETSGTGETALLTGQALF